MEASSPVSAMTTSTRSTYDTDFYSWTQQQAKLLRSGRFAAVDLANVIEEIESLGRSEYNSLVSAIHRLTQHLLKWQYQADLRSSSWQDTIRAQRNQIQDVLDDNPGLKSKLDEVIAKGYKRGRRDAADETKLRLATFPEDCPYSWEQLIDRGWLPDES
jgi:hypothetical protein